jgi:trimethylamine--corrinoid protein Co-methyltransferase
MDRIHESMVRVLEKVGLGVRSAEALDIYAQGGCRVDKAKGIVKIPGYVAERSLSQVPGNIFMAGRNKANDFICGGRRIGFTPFGVGLLVEGLDGGEPYDATLKDFEEIFRICDALDTVDVMLSVVQAVDLPPETQELQMAAAAFKNSSKHYAADAADGKTAEQMVEMASMITGSLKELRDRPIISFGVCPVSPLQLPGEAAEVLMVAAKYGLPIEVLSMAMAGATGPMSLAGTIVVHLAEVIGSIVLAQIVNPGAPSYMGSSTTTFDMKSCAATVGSPEFGLVNAALAEMAHYYKVPVTVGGL